MILCKRNIYRILLITKDFIGSLTRAPFSAVCANLEFELRVSKRSWPFLAMKTHRLTEPLPLPIRTSWGFFVIGICGKTEIQVFASLRRIPLRNFLVDSRCLAEMRPVWRACSPMFPSLKREAFTLKFSEDRREKDLVNFNFWGACNIVLKKRRKWLIKQKSLLIKFV